MDSINYTYARFKASKSKIKVLELDNLYLEKDLEKAYLNNNFLTDRNGLLITENTSLSKQIRVLEKAAVINSDSKSKKWLTNLLIGFGIGVVTTGTIVILN